MQSISSQQWRDDSRIIATLPQYDHTQHVVDSSGGIHFESLTRKVIGHNCLVILKGYEFSARESWVGFAKLILLVGSIGRQF